MEAQRQRSFQEGKNITFPSSGPGLSGSRWEHPSLAFSRSSAPQQPPSAPLPSPQTPTTATSDLSSTESYTPSEAAVVQLSVNPPAGGYTPEQEAAMKALLEKRSRKNEARQARKAQQAQSQHGGNVYKDQVDAGDGVQGAGDGGEAAMASWDMSQYSQLPSNLSDMPTPALRAKADATLYGLQDWKTGPSAVDLQTEKKAVWSMLTEKRAALTETLQRAAQLQADITDAALRLAWLQGIEIANSGAD